MTKIYRTNKMIAGVCGGLGKYFGTDPNLIRALWIIITVLSIGLGVLAYFICWILFPEK